MLLYIRLGRGKCTKFSPFTPQRPPAASYERLLQPPSTRILHPRPHPPFGPSPSPRLTSSRATPYPSRGKSPAMRQGGERLTPAPRGISVTKLRGVSGEREGRRSASSRISLTPAPPCTSPKPQHERGGFAYLVEALSKTSCAACFLGLPFLASTALLRLERYSRCSARASSSAERQSRATGRHEAPRTSALASKGLGADYRVIVVF